MSKENNILCHCGGGARVPHSTGIKGCARYHVVESSEIPMNFRIEDGTLMVDVGKRAITEHTLKHQRGYSQHKCGAWTRPKSKDSINSLSGF